VPNVPSRIDVRRGEADHPQRIAFRTL
jgi:hypothetical protein